MAVFFVYMGRCRISYIRPFPAGACLKSPPASSFSWIRGFKVSFLSFLAHAIFLFCELHRRHWAPVVDMCAPLSACGFIRLAYSPFIEAHSRQIWCVAHFQRMLLTAFILNSSCRKTSMAPVVGICAPLFRAWAPIRRVLAIYSSLFTEGAKRLVTCDVSWRLTLF